MIKRRFVCDRCGRAFEVQVFEPGEAEEKKVPTQPVRCPQCGGSVRKA
jgi:DNA-directed RNA polymerase subunit RPC12/RpoP